MIDLYLNFAPIVTIVELILSAVFISLVVPLPRIQKCECAENAASSTKNQNTQGTTKCATGVRQSTPASPIAVS